jgi:DNA-directed RNA polymerase specialized sigma24 family protein
MTTRALSPLDDVGRSDCALLLAQIHSGLDPDAERQLRTIVRPGLVHLLRRRVPPETDLDAVAEALLDVTVAAVRTGALQTVGEFTSRVRRMAAEFHDVATFGTKGPVRPVIVKASALRMVRELPPRQRALASRYYGGEQAESIARDLGLEASEVVALARQVRREWRKRAEG